MAAHPTTPRVEGVGGRGRTVGWCVVAAVAASALVGGLAPARAAELLGTSERPTTADAYGDTIVWSPWSSRDGLYHLTAGTGADAHELGVAPSARPFVDVN